MAFNTFHNSDGAVSARTIDLRSGQIVKLHDIMNGAELAKARQLVIEFSPETESDIEKVIHDADFYVNDKGGIILAFDKYEIGPGSMGYPELTVGQLK